MKTIIFLFLFSFSTISSAQALTGQKWLSFCEDRINDFKFGVCNGYLMGVSGHHKLIMGIDAVKVTMCLPEKVTATQLVAVSKKWLKEHPEKLHQHFSVSYLSIMKEAFPCNKQDKK
jgi:hypothetical protein